MFKTEQDRINGGRALRSGLPDLIKKITRLKAEYSATEHAGWRRLVYRNSWTIEPAEPPEPDELHRLRRAEAKLAHRRRLLRWFTD